MITKEQLEKAEKDYQEGKSTAENFTNIHSFRNCRRAYVFSKKLPRTNEKMEFGKLFHSLVENYAKNGLMQETDNSIMNFCIKNFLKVRQKYTEFYPEVKMLKDSLKGKADAIACRDGKYYIVELKTVSKFMPELSMEYRKQGLLYVYLAEQVFGIKIAGIDVILFKKDLPEKPKVLKNRSLSIANLQGTTYELFLEAIKENNLNENDYAETLEKLKEQGNLFVKEHYVEINREELLNTIMDYNSFWAVLSRVFENEVPVYPNFTYMCESCLYKNDCFNFELAGKKAEKELEILPFRKDIFNIDTGCYIKED